MSMDTHQLLTYRSVLFVTHIRSSPYGKRDALNRSRFVDVLRSGEAAGSLDAIVVSPQKVIGTEVEVLFAAVAGDFLRELHTKSLPRLSIQGSISSAENPGIAKSS